MSSHKKETPKKTYESLSDEELSQTVKSYTFSLSEALKEQRMRKDQLIEEARKDFNEASKRLCELGAFKSIMPFPSLPLNHGSFIGNKLSSIFEI